jgi:hypothetical protein
MGKWSDIKNSAWWSLLIVAVALAYVPLWWRLWHAAPFNLDAFTDSLLLWNQRLLHVPIFLCIYGICARRWTWFGLSMVFVATWFWTDNALFDIELHRIISEYNAYPNSWKMPNGETNSNYAKIAVFLSIFPFFLLRFFQKEWRTLDRFFALIITCSVISTSLLFHWVWIAREYKLVLNREIVHITTALKVDEATFRDMCKNSDWGCWLGIPAEGKDKNPLITDLLRKDINMLVESGNCEERLCTKLSGSIDPAQNEFSPMPLGAIKKDGQWRFVVDHVFLPKQFLEIRQGLTTLGIVAGNVWIYGFVVLWAFHRNRFKKRAQRSMRGEK